MNLASRSGTIEHLVSHYGMDRADASIATDYASAEGSHAIEGGNGDVLRYVPGRGWYVQHPTRH